MKRIISLCQIKYEVDRETATQRGKSVGALHLEAVGGAAVTGRDLHAADGGEGVGIHEQGLRIEDAVGGVNPVDQSNDETVPADLEGGPFTAFQGNRGDRETGRRDD